MEVQDHNLLVVSLDNCISSGGTVGKPASCIYTAAMSNGACSHETSIVELAPTVQCLSTTMPRLHQHLTQLQPIQYPQTVSYEPVQSMHQHGNLVTGHAIYQPMATAPLHHYTPSQAIISNTTYLNAASAPSQTIHLAPTSSISAPPAISHHQPTQIIQQQSAPEPQPVISTTSERNCYETEVIPEPTFPEDDYEYYMEIYDFLHTAIFPQGVSDNYKRHLRKRAQHYMVLDGKLYHSRKQPKEVVMKKEDQQTMLKEIHVIKDIGIHLGVKKMFNKVHAKHFWRGMYIDVVTFVKNCEKCSDIVDMVRQRQVAAEDNEDCIEDPEGVTQSVAAVQCSEIVKVWKKVEVCVHGPLRRTAGLQELLLTVVDEESRWIVATPLSSADNVSQIADFLFLTFCNYGFANCGLVGFSKEIKDRLAEELKLKVKDINVRLNLIDRSASNCQWVSALVDNLVQTYTDWEQNLNQFLFQFRTGQIKAFCSPYRCTPFSALFNHNPLPLIDCDDENKENIDDDCSVSSKVKPRPQASVLQCEYCEDSFPSKISLRIHLRKHHKSDSGNVNSGRPKLRRNKKKKVLHKDVLKLSTSSPSVTPDKPADDSDFKPPETCVESTVSAVKAFLAATKEERRRRGKYHKYTPELQEHMASYAVKHGNQQAVRYFSEYLGTVVSESTIRNLVKVHSSFTPFLKDEIGRFAANFGVEPAARYFSNRLKRIIPHNLVRKFKLIYLEKLPDATKRHKDRKPRDLKKRGIKKPIHLNTGSKIKRYSSKIKEEIGLYACNHSLSETANYFSNKLQTTVKEWTVKRFHKAYIKRYQLQIEPRLDRSQPISSNEEHSVNPLLPISVNIQQVQSPGIYPTQFPQQLAPTGISSTTSCLPAHPPLSLYPVNHCSSESNCYHTQSSSSSSVIVAQTSNPFHYQSINAIQGYQTDAPYHPHQASPVTQSQQDTTSYVMTQQPLLVSHETNNLNVPTHFVVASQPSNSEIEIQRPLLDKNVPKNISDETETNIVFFVKCENAQPTLENESYTLQTNPPPTGNRQERNDVMVSCQQQQTADQASSAPNKKETSEEEEDEDYIDDEEQPLIKRLNGTRNKRRKTKKGETSKKRGAYTMYSPELRAEIGKYAAEHSSLKACQYFGKLLGHDVPESTARGLKEKYLRKKVHCTVTSLGYSQRGRPLRLGKYDEVVQDCLKELVRSGEKVSSFLAIITAKQILNKCEPELLEDNGGPIKLNTTWAKSFLKRIGVHNNS